MPVITHGKNVLLLKRLPPPCLNSEEQNSHYVTFTRNDRISAGLLVPDKQPHYDRVENEIGGRVLEYNSNRYTVKTTTITGTSGAIFIKAVELTSGTVLNIRKPIIRYLISTASQLDIEIGGTTRFNLPETVVREGFYHVWYPYSGKTYHEILDKGGSGLGKSIILNITPTADEDIYIAATSSTATPYGLFKLAELAYYDSYAANDIANILAGNKLPNHHLLAAGYKYDARGGTPWVHNGPTIVTGTSMYGDFSADEYGYNIDSEGYIVPAIRDHKTPLDASGNPLEFLPRKGLSGTVNGYAESLEAGETGRRFFKTIPNTGFIEFAFIYKQSANEECLLGCENSNGDNVIEVTTNGTDLTLFLDGQSVVYNTLVDNTKYVVRIEYPDVTSVVFKLNDTVLKSATKNDLLHDRELAVHGYNPTTGSSKTIRYSYSALVYLKYGNVGDTVLNEWVGSNPYYDLVGTDNSRIEGSGIYYISHTGGDKSLYDFGYSVNPVLVYEANAKEIVDKWSVKDTATKIEGNTGGWARISSTDPGAYIYLDQVVLRYPADNAEIRVEFEVFADTVTEGYEKTDNSYTFTTLNPTTTIDSPNYTVGSKPVKVSFKLPSHPVTGSTVFQPLITLGELGTNFKAYYIRNYKLFISYPYKNMHYIPAHKTSGPKDVLGNHLEHAGRNAITAKPVGYLFSNAYDGLTVAEIANAETKTFRLEIEFIYTSSGSSQELFDTGETGGSYRIYVSIHPSGTLNYLNCSVNLNSFNVDNGYPFVENTYYRAVATGTFGTGYSSINLMSYNNTLLSNTKNIKSCKLYIDDVLIRYYEPTSYGLEELSGNSNPNLSVSSLVITTDPRGSLHAFSKPVKLVQTPIFTDGITDYPTSIATSGTLDLNGKNLVGTIPPETGNLIKLQYLLLSTNQLTGNIPVELGNLTNLTQLHLHANQLTGNIPAELGNLTNLQYLYLQYNQLSSADDFLIAAANNISSTAWKDTRIDLGANNLTLSSAAQTAKQQLEANGCTLII